MAKDDDELLIDAASESEEKYSDFFNCCVCLDLLYKPVVLACGHASCFWCVHKSMNLFRESNCPICRDPYHHFPAVCWVLHYLLMKMYPVTCMRREQQILEFEKQEDIFSPEFDSDTYEACANKEIYHLRGDVYSTTTRLECNSSLDVSSPNKGEHFESIEQKQNACSMQDGVGSTQHISDENSEVIRSAGGKKFPQKEPKGNDEGISTIDVQCLACKQLLFHPVILNCGHAYCETCIICPKDDFIRCQACQSFHVSNFPKVFLEFDHFLEEKFPNEYTSRTSRRVSIQLKELQNKNTLTCTTEAGKTCPMPVKSTLWSDSQIRVHFGVGCDSCGVYPIVGDRYRCKDCTETIGFDLCGDCYNTASKAPGRFNQRHTPDHKFELKERRNIDLRNIVELVFLRNGGEWLQDGGPTDNIDEISEVSEEAEHQNESESSG